MKFILGLILLAHSFQSFAEHSGNGLVSSAVNLNDMVQYSSLRYRVKQTVNQFTNVVIRYNNCMGQSGDYFEGLKDHRDCADIYRDVEDCFEEVRRYLYDTKYDYPRIYRQFKRVKYSIQDNY